MTHHFQTYDLVYSINNDVWSLNKKSLLLCGNSNLLFAILLFVHVGGRRGAVMLSNVLQFATGADDEPVLGFTIQPTINFVEVSGNASFIPTSNTCINSMSIPRPSHSKPLPTTDQLFNLYDYAFTNTYFGNR